MFNAGIERVRKAAQPRFIAIARIEHQHFRVGDQIVPVLRRHMISASHGGIGVRLIERYDLALESYFQAVERFSHRLGKLYVLARQAHPAAQEGQHRVNRALISGQGPIDPFGRNQ